MKVLLVVVLLGALACVRAQDQETEEVWWLEGYTYPRGSVYYPPVGRHWGPEKFSSKLAAKMRENEIVEAEKRLGRICACFAITKQYPNVDERAEGKRDIGEKLKCEVCDVGLGWVAGDAHYYTFDGEKINFQGTCVYLLTLYNQSPEHPGLPSLQLIGTNGHPKPRMTKISVLMELRIIYNMHNIIFGEDGEVTVDGAIVTSATNYPSSFGFTVYPGETVDEFISDIGLRVNFERAKFSADIFMPDEYQGLLNGLLGNFNGDPADDRSDYFGNVQPANKHGDCLIGNSYQLPVQDEPCSYECP